MPGVILAIRWHCCTASTVCPQTCGWRVRGWNRPRGKREFGFGGGVGSGRWEVGALLVHVSPKADRKPHRNSFHVGLNLY